MGYIKNDIRHKPKLHARLDGCMALDGRTLLFFIPPEKFGPPVIPRARGGSLASECVYFTHDLARMEKAIPNHQHRRCHHAT